MLGNVHMPPGEVENKSIICKKGTTLKGKNDCKTKG